MKPTVTKRDPLVADASQNSLPDISHLTERQFDILKHESQLLEARISHLESLQFRLRQFSIVLWSLALTVGFGVTKLAEAEVRLVAASLTIPLVFGFLDAWYARAAQRFRTRRLEIAEVLNGTGRGRDSSPCPGTQFLFLDMMASRRREADPRARYREKLLTKLTRTVRMTFYSFQMCATALLLTVFVISVSANEWYLWLAVAVALALASLIVLSRYTTRRWRARFPEIPPEEFSRRTEQLYGQWAKDEVRDTASRI